MAPEEKAKITGKEMELVIENTLEDRMRLLRQIMKYKKAKLAERSARLAQKSNEA